MQFPEDCKHEVFKAEANVARLFKDENSTVITDYRVDITVTCDQCFKPFSFIGFPGGYSPSYPTVSADTITARIPIKPL